MAVPTSNISITSLQSEFGVAYTSFNALRSVKALKIPQTGALAMSDFAGKSKIILASTQEFEALNVSPYLSGGVEYRFALGGDGYFYTKYGNAMWAKRSTWLNVPGSYVGHNFKVTATSSNSYNKTSDSSSGANLSDVPVWGVKAPSKDSTKEITFYLNIRLISNNISIGSLAVKLRSKHIYEPPYCLDLDTKIYANGETKKIGDLSIGDSVMSWHEPGMPPESQDAWQYFKTNTLVGYKSLGTVIGLKRVEESSWVEINGMKCTESHFFWCLDRRTGFWKWVKAIDIEIGIHDFLGINGERIPAVTKSLNVGNKEFMKIDIDLDTFFAGEVPVLSHNAKGGGGGDEP